MNMTATNQMNCPVCGSSLPGFKNPALTVDIIIESQNAGRNDFILIKRKNPPFGWAIPGGFVEYGECVEDAAIREAKEETNLDITILSLLGVYSDPKRDPRGHTVSVVFIAHGKGHALASDDAKELSYYSADDLPEDMVFDHRRIISDYLKEREIA